MKWLQIAGWDVKLAEDQDEYATIVARKHTSYVQRGALLVPVASLVAEIQPEPEELKRLNEGGSLFLTILGGGWPPCSVSTLDPKITDELAAGTA